MHKLFKHTTLMNIFFAVLMSIPLISIGVRCAYVTINKNAYLSYSGTQTNYVRHDKYENGNVTDLGGGYYEIEYNKMYYLNFDNEIFEDIIDIGTQSNVYFKILNGSLNLNDVFDFYIDAFGSVEGDDETLYGWDQYNGLYITYTYNGYYVSTYFESPLTIHGTVIFYDYDETEANIIFNADIFDTNTYNEYEYTEIQSSNLDNVFEYSINQFISSNDLGNLNFFTWFNGVFFTNNAQASTYINFINWYMNYMLLVSCGYILFMMLLWFVNFVRKILDRSMNFYDR